MANVGNLFINVTGNTKGLTKALSSAKTKLATFDKQVGRPRGDFMRRARGRFTSAMNERRRFSQQMSSFIGPQPAGYVEKMQARLGKKEKGARQGYRQAQREQVMGGMTARTRMITAGVLGVLGLTVGGVSMMARKAMSQIQSAKIGVEKFRYIGPQGKRVIKAEMDMLMNSISSARSPEVSEALAQKAEAKLAAQVESNAGGGTVMYVTLEEYMERMGQVFTNSISGLFNNPAAGLTAIVTGNPTLNTALNVANNTQGASNP
jgi:hypothetical protein